MDWKEAIGAIVAGVVLLLPAIKWLISDWAKKAEEIELLKTKNTSKALDRFEDDLKEFRATVRSVQAEIKDIGAKILIHSGKLSTMEERLVEIRSSIDAHAANMAGNVRQLIKTELVELSKTAALIRDKKNGG